MRGYSYEKNAQYYDTLELHDNTRVEKMLSFIEKRLHTHNVRTVLDATCGTGAQAIPLSVLGFDVTAADLSPAMLKIARKKSREKKTNIRFLQKNICTGKYPQKYDAILAMYNAIGHLTPEQFLQALHNMRDHLRSGGLFIFDIFNREFMESGGFIGHKFIDTALTVDNVKFVRYNKNSYDARRGIMRVKQEIHLQHGIKPYEVVQEKWDMQLYSAKEIHSLLEQAGFSGYTLFGNEGAKFSKKKSLSILCVARK